VVIGLGPDFTDCCVDPSFRTTEDLILPGSYQRPGGAMLRRSVDDADALAFVYPIATVPLRCGLLPPVEVLAPVVIVPEVSRHGGLRRG